MNPSSHRFRPRALAVAAALAAWTAAAVAATPQQILTAYAAKAGTQPSADRGRSLFTTRHGAEWSCSTCHGERPTAPGRHATTGKGIAPLAPGFDARRFTDPPRVEKWFRRNCNDVMGRECSASEKADVIAWLLTLNP